MRVSSVDSLLTNNNITIDEQIKYYNGKNSSQENCSDDEKSAKNFNKGLDKLCNKIEKQLCKVDKKVLTQSFYEYVKTPDEITSFSNHLISHLENIDPHEEIVLFYFLQTAICYSIKSTKEECTLEELITGALLLYRGTKKTPIEDTFFDNVIKFELEECTDNSLLDLKLYYERFCNHRNEDSLNIILKHLVKIAKKYKPYKPQN